VLPVSILFVSLSLYWSVALLLLRCCVDGVDSPLLLLVRRRWKDDVGNLLGLNIYTSGDVGSLLRESRIVSTNPTGIYRHQRAWCRECCVHYCNILFRPIWRSKEAWEKQGLNHSLGLLLLWFFPSLIINSWRLCSWSSLLFFFSCPVFWSLFSHPQSSVFTRDVPCWLLMYAHNAWRWLR